MKLIFLDVDGVLNYSKCLFKSPTGCIGIDSTKVALLKLIVEKTNAKIILTSTWKQDWFKDFPITDMPKDGAYLVTKLADYGLTITDKTSDLAWSKRGEGIIQYIDKLEEKPESIVILDDESFDFKKTNLTKYFVKTDYYNNGLQEAHVEQAIRILEEENYDN